MRTLTTFLIACMVLFVYADENHPEQIKSSSAPLLEISLEPAGFLFYGPTVNAGIGISEKTSIQAYIRAFGMGSMSVELKDAPEDNNEFNGMHYGVGIMQYLGNGGSGLYVGAQAEFGTSDGRWSVGEQWEWFEESTNIAVTGKGGYRFAMESGLFVDLGVFAGIINMDSSWDYQDQSYGMTDPEPREHSSSKFIFAPELRIGFTIL